jgi:hypothetical protein
MKGKGGGIAVSDFDLEIITCSQHISVLYAWPTSADVCYIELVWKTGGTVKQYLLYKDYTSMYNYLWPYSSKLLKILHISQSFDVLYIIVRTVEFSS